MWPLPNLLKKSRRTSSLQGEALLRAIDVLNNQLTQQTSASFLRTIQRATGSPEIAIIVDEIRAGRGLSSTTASMIDQISLGEDTLHDLYSKAYLKGGRATSRVYSDVVRFNPQNPRVLEHIMTDGLTRIKGINSQTRNAYKQVIYDSIKSGLGPNDVADLIKPQLGLTYRQSQAVGAMRQRLFAQGMPKGRANRQAADYAKTMLRQRAETIAETEMAAALEMGKIEYWTQAQAAGLLGQDEVAVWVTEDDDKVDEECLLLEGLEVPIIDFRSDPNIPMPPIHPRCRCQWVLGSGKTFSNRAKLPTDRRLLGGQTTNRFVNPTSGHIMGKTETGDVYESAMYLGAKDMIEDKFQGSLVPITNRSGGVGMNAPVDFEILPWDGSKPYAVEVKSMHQLSKNKKTAIKSPEYARKMAYVLDTDDARAVVNVMVDKDPESVAAAMRKLDGMLDDIGGLANAPKEPMILVQVVDDTTLSATGQGSVRISVRSYVGDYPSKALSRFDEVGEYVISQSGLESAVVEAGHGGVKISQRALKQVLDGLDELDDPFGWHPLTTRDGTVNNPISLILESLQAESTESLGGRFWYTATRNQLDFDPDLADLARRTIDTNARLGVHLTSDRAVADQILDAGGGVIEGILEMRNPRIYGLPNSRRYATMDDIFRDNIRGTRNTKPWSSGVSSSEDALNLDMLKYVFQSDLMDDVPGRPRSISGSSATVQFNRPYGLGQTIGFNQQSEIYDFLDDFHFPGKGRVGRTIIELDGRTKADIIRQLWGNGMDFDDAVGLVMRDLHNYGPDDSIFTAAARGARNELNGLDDSTKQLVANRYKRYLADQGYDGIVYYNTTETAAGFGQGPGNWSAIAFNERQILTKPLWEMTQEEWDRIAFPGFGRTTRIGVTAEARPLDGIIQLGDDFWKLSSAEKKHVLLHETGHSLEHKVMGELRLKKAWESLPLEVKGYSLGSQSSAESLAEAYARMWVDEKAFKKAMPQAYKFISSVADQYDFPVPSTSPGFTPRLRKWFMMTKALARKTWTCGTLPSRVPDQWNEEVIDGEWYIENMGTGTWIVPFLVDATETLDVVSDTNELHF